jgi:hypothetical protein
MEQTPTSNVLSVATSDCGPTIVPKDKGPQDEVTPVHLEVISLWNSECASSDTALLEGARDEGESVGVSNGAPNNTPVVEHAQEEDKLA